MDFCDNEKFNGNEWLNWTLFKVKVCIGYHKFDYIRLKNTQ